MVIPGRTSIVPASRKHFPLWSRDWSKISSSRIWAASVETIYKSDSTRSWFSQAMMFVLSPFMMVWTVPRVTMISHLSVICSMTSMPKIPVKKCALSCERKVTAESIWAARPTDTATIRRTSITGSSMKKQLLLSGGFSIWPLMARDRPKSQEFWNRSRCLQPRRCMPSRKANHFRINRIAGMKILLSVFWKESSTPDVPVTSRLIPSPTSWKSG